MYQMRYEDVLVESGVSAREREMILFDRCIDMLESAQKNGPYSEEAKIAVRFVDTFWTMLIEDLAHPENALPKELRASFISIGVYVLKEIEKLGKGDDIDYENIISILKSIRDGLGYH